MTKEQAINIIKQTIDGAVKIGFCQNIEVANSIFVAWQTILLNLKKEENEL